MSTGAGPSVSSYPAGFNNGVSIRGITLAQTHPGKAVWLSNGPFQAPSATAGSDGNDGTFTRPCATLAGALLKCVAGRGDMIMVKPGHQETISTATALIMSVSGVAVIGLGAGALRPTFILATATTATINVVADDVTFQNCVFYANLANIASAFTLGIASVTASLAGNTLSVTVLGSGYLYVGARVLATGIPVGTYITSQVSGTANGVGVYSVSGAGATVASTTVTTTARGFTLDNCDVLDTSAILNFLICVSFGTVANAFDGISITRNRIVLLATSGVVNLMPITASTANVTIADNYFQSATTNAAAVIPQTAAKVLTGFQLLRNNFNVQNATGTGTGYLMTTGGVTTNTGFVHGNYDHALPTTPLLITATSGLYYGLNYHSDAADNAGYLIPAADS